MSILLRTVRLIPRPASIVSRQISSEHKIDPSDDLNHVILLGTVNGVNRATDPGKNHVSISLRTRDVYRAAKGYGMKVVSHR
ncbi:unnamed protein product [Echinostoma caproni]|uniref:40S ribosomal protein S14 n=1 Tax=Echinostoma caproni TaxID=27848 RepID=A0A183A2X8_9TREM|nr:unnamed protein product [Echinostoma caproni]